jgi:serine protease inhibitor
MRTNPVLACIILIGLVGCDTKPTTKETTSGSNKSLTQEKDSRDPKPIKADDSEATPGKIESICDTNNRFALDLYKRLFEKNIFFSPYSIRTALAMVFEGARGNTAREMATKLYLPPDPDIRRPNFAAVFNLLHSQQDIELLSANALWIQKNFPLVPNYLSTIERYYVGKAQLLDFADSPEESIKQINSWVGNQTKGKITNLMTPDLVDKLTRLVLTNAIYFNAAWLHQFDLRRTHHSIFLTNQRRGVSATMMIQENKFNYTEDDTVQVLEMPYQGERFAMLIVLPKKTQGLADIEEQLTTEQIALWRSQLDKKRLDILIPKVTFTSRFQLKETLSSMGMTNMFRPGADFSGISDEPGLYVGEVIHQAFVRIYEEGTEAAAATEATVRFLGAQPVPITFRADHPFLFLILDNKTGLIIFMGRISDPSELQEIGANNEPGNCECMRETKPRPTENWCHEIEDAAFPGCRLNDDGKEGDASQCNTTLTGSISKKVINQIIQSHRIQIKSCYLKELPRNPKIKDQVYVRFIISPSGIVYPQIINALDKNNFAVEQCIIEKIKTWKFPIPTGGGIVSFVHQFIFKQM